MRRSESLRAAMRSAPRGAVLCDLALRDAAQRCAALCGAARLSALRDAVWRCEARRAAKSSVPRGAVPCVTTLPGAALCDTVRRCARSRRAALVWSGDVALRCAALVWPERCCHLRCTDVAGAILPCTAVHWCGRGDVALHCAALMWPWRCCPALRCTGVAGAMLHIAALVLPGATLLCFLLVWPGAMLRRAAPVRPGLRCR